MKPLVECVPNFSEGQRPEVIGSIVEAMRSVPEVRVLDVESDGDHNRSVVTLVGPPAVVQEAAFRGIKTAAQLIDMDNHRGEHPRLGATDVVPFIPVSGVPMQECVTLAHDLGRRVGEALAIPVYFYERAALSLERENLEDVRRGEYELLKKEIEHNPARKPDFGPCRVGKAGAVIIGARSFLIAFNAYLNTDNLSIARKIARAVRHSSGGYRYIKAMGIMVAGQAQVSMNFTNFRATPLHRVLETIRSEAARYGTHVTHTELVGLAPQQALLDAACWHLQLDDLDADHQILENKLSAVNEEPPWGFVDALASNSPTPGGGAAAALAGALAASLTSMVGRLTVGKRRYAEVKEELSEAILKAEQLRAALTARIAEDSAAFDAVMLAYKLPKNTPERESAIRTALTRAAEVPLANARDALEVMALAVLAAEKGNPNAVTDAATSAWMAMAAIQGAVWNVRINANSSAIAEEQRAVWLEASDELLTQAQVYLEQVQGIAARRTAPGEGS